MSDAFKPLLARLADGATLTEEDAESFFGAALSGGRQMPASFGVHGPGDSRMASGRSASASCTLIWSLRTTSVSAPSSFR